MSAPRRPVEPRPADGRGARGASRATGGGTSRATGAGASRADAADGSRERSSSGGVVRGRPGADATGEARAPGRSTSARSRATRGTAGRASTPSRGVPRATSRPGATRPGGRAPATPPRGTARAERAQVAPPRLFSVRTIVLGCVLVLAFVLVYPTLHTYLRQEADLRALRAQVAAARERNDDLEAELGRWDNPAYVTAQARERLSYVLPGEKAYRVVDPESVQDPDDEVADETPVVATTAEVPWYTSVWESLVVAGETSDEPADAGTTGGSTGTKGSGKASSGTSSGKDATSKDATPGDDSSKGAEGATETTAP
ncbi:septum formation initiator family protein [Cellulomonas persica]